MGIILTVLTAGIVYKAAEMGNRSGLLWGAISIGITIISGFFIPFSFAVGLFGTFIIMLVCNLISNPSKG